MTDRSSSDIRQKISISLQLAFEGGEYALTYDRRIFRRWASQTIQIKIQPRLPSRSLVLVENAGHVDYEKTGDLLVQVTYADTDGRVEMSCVGNLHCELTVPWSAALRQERIAFEPFKGGKEAFGIKILEK